MEIQIWWIGKTSFNYLETGIQDYCKRIEKYNKFKIVEFKGSKNQTDPDIIRNIEEKNLHKKIMKGDYIILLDELGKRFSSRNFAQLIQTWQNTSIQRVIFIIGGAFGFSKEFKEASNLELSFSDFTMSHQLIRLVFAEQLYRAFTIINNQPYHND
jgi:23S rRNA (pseudouridine1915-N3)-methyltransferase